MKKSLKHKKSTSQKARRKTPKEERTKIPNQIAREVRQRCGFGCVICGLPLYQYEHMNEWALVKRHVASEITLLCDRHHREKTGGLLSIEKVRFADTYPKNRNGTSSPYMFYPQPSDIVVQIGSNALQYNGDDQTGIMVVISIAATPILWFRFDEGNLLMNLSLYDKLDNLVLSIEDNELTYSMEPWDIHLVGTTLTIQAAARDTMLALTIAPNENRISIEKAKLRFSGYEVHISDKGMSAIPALQGCLIRGEGHLFNYGNPEVQSALLNLKV